MAQTVTNQLPIIYDPLTTIFDVHVLGGDLEQIQNSVTGEYEPDRTDFPVMLQPSLLVSDPNEDTTGVEVISSCTVTWYLVDSSNVRTEITSTTDTDPYYLSGKNLVIKTNIQAGSYQNIYLVVNYTSITNGTLHYEKPFSLTTKSYVDFVPMLQVDSPTMLTVSPYLLSDASYSRTITATFFAGATDISTNSKTVYVWEKLEGTTYRAITNTDIEVTSIPTRSVTIDGVATTVQYRTMVLDLRCVGRCKYRCTAYHADYSDDMFKASVLFTVDREFYGERIENIITSGKFLKSSTTKSEAKAAVHVNSSLLTSPLNYYRFYWNFYLLYGSTRGSETTLGWGESIEIPRTLSGTDKSKIPTVELVAHHLSELQILTDGNNEIITDDSGSSTASDYSGYLVGEILAD